MDRLDYVASIKEVMQNEQEQNSAIVKQIIDKLIDNLDWSVPINAEFSSQLNKTIKSEFDKEIVWQDEAKQVFTNALLSLNRDREREWILWSFLFMGPSGVWKTEMAKQLAKQLLWLPYFLTIVSCEQFTERHTVTNLFGAPKSYVWYWEPPILSDINLYTPYAHAFQQKWLHPLIDGMWPVSIVLFDEIEKAHPVVVKTLMWAMQNWFVELSSGREDDKKCQHSKITPLQNTIFIFTSNVWADQVRDEQNRANIGFGKKEEVDRPGIYKQTLNKMFPTEFLGRLNEIVTFDRLTEKDAEQIADKNIDKIKKRIETEYPLFRVKVSNAVYKKVVEDAFDSNYWARRIKQYIDSTIWAKFSHLEQGKVFEHVVDHWSGLQSMFEIQVKVKNGKFDYRIWILDIPIIWWWKPFNPIRIIKWTQIPDWPILLITDGTEKKKK